MKATVVVNVREPEVAEVRGKKKVFGMLDRQGRDMYYGR